MMKNQLQKASDHRREANALYKRSDRIKPLTIILIGLALVAGMTGKIVLAFSSIMLGIALLAVACWLNRAAYRHWRQSQAIVRKATAFSFRSMQEAARRRLEVQENCTHGRGQRPIV